MKNKKSEKKEKNTTGHITTYVSHVTAATLCSRIFGFIRDALVAYVFGATIASDAFYAAYRIANLFRRLFGEGAFSSAFIPVFSSYAEKQQDESKRFARIMIGNLLTIVLFLTFFGIVCAPFLVRILASGFRNNPEQLALTVTLARIMFPYFIFISIAACVMGVLQTNKIFFIPALAPLSLSLSIIIYIGIIVPRFCADWSLARLSVGLAVSVLVGGAGQLLFMIPSFLRQGYSIIPRISFPHTGSKRVFRLMVPAMMGISIDQVNMFISATFLASFLAQGSVTALYYSDRLTQFPLALFGIAMASVALPMMSSAMSQNRPDELKDVLNYALRMVGFLTIPSCVGLIVLGLPIIRVLFERGVFDARATQMTYYALVPFSVAMIAFSLVKILANAFYSMQDTKKPMQIACVCMGINVVFSIILMRPFAVAGLAAASAIAAITNVVLLIIYLRKKIGLLGFKKIARSYIKILCASGVMGAGAYAVSLSLSGIGDVAHLILSICAGCAVYALMSMILNIEERKHILSIFSRKFVAHEPL